MNAIPLPLLCPIVPGSPRTETRSIANANTRFGSPVAAPNCESPLLDSPEILTDEVTALRLQLATAQEVAAAYELELDRARADIAAELAISQRLLTRIIDESDRLTRAQKYAATEHRCAEAWERECVKLLIENANLKAEIAERDADTIVVEVGL